METERLLLEEWSSEYLDDFARMVADPNVMKYISRGRPLSREEAESISRRGEALWAEHGIGPWAAFDKEMGTWVGRIGLNLLADWPGPHKWEVGFELVPVFWGRGLATEGARAGIDVGFAQPGLERIISVTAADHQASHRVMEKIGLTYRGSVKWRSADVVWYAIDRP